MTAQRTAMTKKADLIGELYKTDPSNEKLVKLLPMRWQTKAQLERGNTKPVLSEIDEVFASTRSPVLKTEAAYSKVQLTLMGSDDPKKTVEDIDAFIKLAPKDPRGGDLLVSAASYVIKDQKTQTELLNRVIKDYPTGRAVNQAKGTLKKLDGIGKPFELDFTDAITGSEVSMKGLKGKVVVVDFWATWCGPCVAEMPKMKKLYAEYKDKGVEFIGVSLDQPKEKGGLDKLKAFVAENQIGWPQYYQGNYWQSEFSSGWGINSIPAVFVVDTEGKLFSINGRGNLEKFIPELLKKAKTTSEAGGGN
jgi:thiol-disulfide isomerase/thioredoxin